MTTYDGFDFGPDADIDDLVGKHLRGRLGVRPRDNDYSPAQWLGRAYRALETSDPAAAARLSGAIGRQLTFQDLAVDQAVIEFFRSHPTAPGGEAVHAAATDHLDRFADRRAQVILAALALRSSGEPPDAVRKIAREYVLSGHGRALVGEMGRLDPEWARTEMSRAAPLYPDAAATFFDLFQEAGMSEEDALERALAHADEDGRAAIAWTIEQRHRDDPERRNRLLARL